GRCPDPLSPPPQKHLNRSRDLPRKRLETHQMLRLPHRPPTTLLLGLSGRCPHCVLARVHHAPEQLIPPLLSDEPIPPRHQHSIVIIHDERDRDPIQVHHVVLPPLPVRRLNVHQPQPHPPIVIDHPLPKRPPTAALPCHGGQRRRGRRAALLIALGL